MTTAKKKLRIAFLVRFFPGLTETFILTQIVDLLKKGHEIQIVAMPTPPSPVIHGDIHRYRLLDRTCYIAKMPPGKWKRRIDTAGRILFHAVRHPVDLFRLLGAHLGASSGFDYESFYYGLSFLGKRFDILHAHFGYSGKAAAMLKKAGMAQRIITTFHGSDVNRYPKIHGRTVYDNLFRAGDLFTVNTAFTGRRLQDLGCHPEKIQILPVGLDLHSFSFRERTFPEDGRLRILTVGRLVEKKGHRYMIEALSKIVPHYPNLQYLIAGDGELNLYLRDLAREMNLEKQVHFLGPLSAEQVRRVYDQAHLFVLPSVTSADGDMEGQGLVLQEAQAAGLPVVSTLHNGIPEGVLDGRSGLLVPEKDSGALAQALFYLLEHPETWAAMGRCGHQWAAERYDIEQLNQKLEDFYMQVLELK